MFLTNPIEIKSDENGFVDSIVCRQNEVIEPDESGRARPVEVAGSEFEIKTHSVIMALGTSPNPLIRKTTKGIKFNMHVRCEDYLLTIMAKRLGGHLCWRRCCYGFCYSNLCSTGCWKKRRQGNNGELN